MTRPAAAILLAILAAASITLERVPSRPQTEIRRWLGANTLPATPEIIVSIQCAAPNGLLSPLDAALVLRAVERFRPAGIAFLAPIARSADAPLLISRIRDATVPLVFTGAGNLPALMHVTVDSTDASIASGDFVEPPRHLIGAASSKVREGAFVAGVATGVAVPSSGFLFLLEIKRESPARVTGSIPGTLRGDGLIAPIHADGFSQINPLASSCIHVTKLDDILLAVERAERGEISPALEQMFRNRLVVVEATESISGLGFAALKNGLAEGVGLPWWSAAVVVAIASTLPWWAARRRERLVLALAASLTWALLALGIYQEFRIVAPIAFVAWLPVFAILPIAPRRSKLRESEPPATQP